MQSSPRRLPSLGIVAILLLAGPAGAFRDDPGTRELVFPLAAESVPVVHETHRIEDTAIGRGSTLGTGWFVQPNLRTGTLHAAYGGDVFLAAGIESEDAAADLARAFLLGHADVTGVRAENLQLRNVAHARGKWAVHFEQVLGGVPVHRGNAFVVLGESGRVAAFGSDFHTELPPALVSPALSAAQAIGAAAAALGATPRTDRPITADLLYVPAPAGESFELRIAYRVVFDSDEPFGTWDSIVHGVTGEILARANRTHAVNVIGNVEADVQDFGYCDGHFLENPPHMTVNVGGGGSAETDVNGDFDISHGGTNPVTVTTEFRGPFLNVNRFSGLGPDGSFSGSATPGVPLQISWDNSNSRQDERDTFQHTNRAHDFVTGIDPLFTGMDFAMNCVVGRTDFVCPGNAWWSGSGLSINFCEAGGGFANTGEIGNVVYHEYGHGVSQILYSEQGSFLPSGDMHEGNSDVIANFIDRNSVIGFGFFQGNCTSGIRDADNSLQWPSDNDGGHFGGQIIAGFYWDAWQSLLASEPQAVADDAAWSAWHFSRKLGTPLTQPDQVLWTFIADDDDADLANGTPNHAHWCLGATNHGFSCPEITAGVFITHQRLPHTTDGSLGFDVTATIVSTVTGLDPSQLLVEYRVNGGSFNTLLMTATGNPDEFSAHIPALGQNSEVDYYISAADLAANTATDPTGAPAVVHSFDVAHIYDDLEGGVAGWTIGASGDNASQGIWGLFDPVGTVAQPEDDATPGAGTLAFITGQCAAGEGSCGAFCTNSCNDVDGGKTTLLSPVYDLAGAVGAKVKYERWYSNDTGLSPGIDHWIVDVSNDGGATWTNIEDTTQSNAAWTSAGADLGGIFGTLGQVRIRFRAQDLGNDSVVEAAVDDLRLLVDFGGAVDVSPPGPARPLVLALSQNQPNPFRPATRIEYSIPGAGEVDLTVYNVHGQVVRNLVRGVREPGHHHVRWDGRDSGGNRVAAGVYFYRLTARDEVVTRKMTVMK